MEEEIVLKDEPVILGGAEIETRLSGLDGWERIDNKIAKEYEFNSFMDALTFIIKLAPFYEAHDHHADMKIMYNKVKFELQRFDVGGKITDKDFEVAEHIEKVFKDKNNVIRNYSGVFD